MGRKKKRNRQALYHRLWLKQLPPLKPRIEPESDDEGGPWPETNIEIFKNQRLKETPWPIEDHVRRSLYRVYNPEDLYDIDALRKAILRELEADRDGSGEEDVEGVNAGRTLEHVLRCWNANLTSLETAGPEFLIHFLKDRYDNSELGFSSLRAKDERQVNLLCRASDATNVFHVFLARFSRIVCGVYQQDTHKVRGKWGELQIEAPRCALDLKSVVHANKKEVKRVPSITEVDFLEEWHFERQQADGREIKKGKIATDFWERVVVVIVPGVCVDHFLDYDDLIPLRPMDSKDEQGQEQDDAANREDEIEECVPPVDEEKEFNGSWAQCWGHQTQDETGVSRETEMNGCNDDEHTQIISPDEGEALRQIELEEKRDEQNALEEFFAEMEKVKRCGVEG